MRPLLRRTLQVLAAALAFGAGAAAAQGDGPLNVHVYAFSYHPDRESMRRTGMDNELNLGVGLNYTLHEDERSVQFVEAGLFRDSGRQLAMIAGLGYQQKFGRWRLGGALAGVQSETYNQGRFFIAPLPIVTYDFGPVKLNAIYVPRYRDVNLLAVFGFYFSLPLPR